jgi:Alpha-L-arabinofuranosidase B (ABFB) domain
VSGRSSSSTRDDATVTVRTGLTDAACFSFQLSGGRYLRHRDYRLRFDHYDGSDLFRRDATFCARAQPSDTVAFESVNYPGYFIHLRSDGQLWIDRHPRASEAVFRVTAPLA